MFALLLFWLLSNFVSLFSSAAMDRNIPLTKERVLELVAAGQTIIIYKDDVLKLDKWLDRHPGGRLAILHMVGTDATDEIEV